jgi:hypothetical protein
MAQTTYFSKLESPPNPELFYDYQISRKKLTWRLKSGGVILKGFLDEGDLVFHVSHSYSGAQDKLGIVDTLANKGNEIRDWTQYGENAYKQLDDLARDVEDAMGVGHGLSSAISTGQQTIEDWMTKATDLVLGEGSANKISEKVKKYAGRGHWFSALEFIKVFRGTSIEFQIPELKTIILSGVNEIKVNDTINELNDIFIGEVEEFSGMFGLQDSPNQYLPTFQGLGKDVKFPGTFELELGERVTLNNLVCTNYQVSISKFNRRNPDGSTDSDPLYAEVTVSLEPAAYVTKQKLKGFLK